MISTLDRQTAITLINKAVTAGARRAKACAELELSERTLRRWTLGGQERVSLANRALLYAKARTQKPERWSGKTRNWQPAGPVWLNPERENSASEIRDAA